MACQTPRLHTYLQLQIRSQKGLPGTQGHLRPLLGRFACPERHPRSVTCAATVCQGSQWPDQEHLMNTGAMLETVWAPQSLQKCKYQPQEYGYCQQHLRTRLERIVHIHIIYIYICVCMCMCIVYIYVYYIQYIYTQLYIYTYTSCEKLDRAKLGQRQTLRISGWAVAGSLLPCSPNCSGETKQTTAMRSTNMVQRSLLHWDILHWKKPPWENDCIHYLRLDRLPPETG